MPDKVAGGTAATPETVVATGMSAAATLPSRRGVSESIQVFLRIRPLIDRETSHERTANVHSIRATDHQTIEVRTAESTIKCSYDAVFDHTFSQEQVYERVSECTQAFLEGFNATLFAYGQTGSGKSFTMFGAETDLSRYRPGLQKSLAGIIPRAIKDIFAAVVQKESSHQAIVYCSFVQIYNEQIFDLLRDSNMSSPLEIREDRKSGIYVDGLSEYAVQSVNDCLTLLQCGEQHRAVRSTHMNQVSSRSHSVFQLLLEQRKRDNTVLKSKFNLVDLAGSEKWNAEASMMSHHVSEMTNINLSLHTLGRCIAALSAKPNAASSASRHVPFRDSKLTRLCADSLGGNTKTKIIATLSPSLDCIDESISTLKFADRAKQVMVTVRVNEQREIDPAYVEKLENELEQLRDAMRLLKGAGAAVSSGVGADGNSSNNNNSDEVDETNLRARLVRALNENTELKQQNERQQREIELLRQRSSGSNNSSNGATNANNIGASAAALDSSVTLAKQQLETTLRQLKDASDRFFRYEIEEDELKSIHARAFQSVPLSAASSSSVSPLAAFASNGSGAGKSSLTKPSRPTPPLLRSPGSFSSNSSKVPLTAAAAPASDLLYRVRGRTTSVSDKPTDWKHDTLGGGNSSNSAVDVERELELSRRAIEKQTRLQQWLVEKEKRELLKLQTEQQFLDDQRRAAAEKDAKFYKHAAATKKKLLVAAATDAASKPSTADN